MTVNAQLLLAQATSGLEQVTSNALKGMLPTPATQEPRAPSAMLKLSPIKSMLKHTSDIF